MIEISISSLIALCISCMTLGINIYKIIEMLILKWLGKREDKE